jgi:F-type H+-transporting ATPase subunit alpha
MKSDLAQFREMAAFAKFGSDLDAATQRQLNRGARLTSLLKQPQYSPLSMEEQVLSIYAGTRGYLDSVAVDDVQRYESELLAYAHANHADLLKTIRDEKKLTDDTEAKVKDVIEAFGKTFS